MLGAINTLILKQEGSIFSSLTLQNIEYNLDFYTYVDRKRTYRMHNPINVAIEQ